MASGTLTDPLGIKTKTVSGTTGAAGQFNTGSGSGVTILAVKCQPYIGFARLDDGIWWGFLKNWDLSSPGTVDYSATIYYIVR